MVLFFLGVQPVLHFHQADRRMMKDLRKIGKRQDEMGRQSRGGQISRTQEKGKATAEMGGLREEGHEKIGGG